MSRHRFVRGMDLATAQDDYEALSDGGEDPDDEITPEQLAQMNSVREHVRAVIGNPKKSGITDKEIDDASWDYYFDLDQTMDYILDVQSKRNAAKERQAAKEKEKQERMAAVRGGVASGAATPVRGNKKNKTAGVLSGTATPIHRPPTQLDIDMIALNLKEKEDLPPKEMEEPPKASFTREALLEQAKKSLAGEGDAKISISLVIIGHVDAGKSTLTGRLLYDLGRIEARKRTQTDRASQKSGKGSFTWAWELDSGEEERDRGITIDIAQTVIPLPTRELVVLDAPGHKDFVPNMISGASQADCALLVVDATTGEFEAGFDKGGQTREHLILVRSLGVQQLVVAVNKLDTVEWSKDRYNEIVESLSQFLVQTGFHPSKTTFAPVAGFLGVNLVTRDIPEASRLSEWYSGPTLVELLEQLEPPGRAVEAPFRFPVTNVFRGQTAVSSGYAVSGTICSGLIQVGEVVRVVPGDESAIIKLIERDGETMLWAAAGSNVHLYLTGIDSTHLSIGSVLCSPASPVPLASSIVAQVILFDIQTPLINGASVELFHHARNVPATITLLESLDRVTGVVLKAKPRVLTKGMSGKIRITIRAGSISETAGLASFSRLPVETFKTNKDMGRVLLRRDGETIAAGIILSYDT